MRTMRLAELAGRLFLSRLEGDGETVVSDICMDHRRVKPGDLFVCIRGASFDGHSVAAEAVARGARALVVERDVEADAPKLFVPDSRYALPVIAAHFFGHPSREMRVVAVTGTNGKTTTTFLLERLLASSGAATGLMGNLGVKIGDRFEREEGMNTRESVDLQRTLRRMADAGVRWCVLEATSQGLHKGRLIGCEIRTAVFTNLTQDHLDYHGTMEAYRTAKGLLFARLGNAVWSDESERKFAVLNADDPASAFFRELTAAEVITYGVKSPCDVRASDVALSAEGATFSVTAFGKTVRFRTKLVGMFNVYNALAAVAAALPEGVTLERARDELERFGPVEGRMETVDEGQPFSVVVDYAHTPDGLENALSTLRAFTKGRLIVVFGAGGDRDRAKRPLMGKAAAKYCDYVWVTSDNPRSEDPEAIMRDIEVGLAESGYPADRYALIADRRRAIEKAIEMASPNDVVLIAGKGHETYQIVGNATYPFDDRAVAREAIRACRKGRGERPVRE